MSKYNTDKSPEVPIPNLTIKALEYIQASIDR